MKETGAAYFEKKAKAQPWRMFVGLCLLVFVCVCILFHLFLSFLLSSVLAVFGNAHFGSVLKFASWRKSA